jgi:hypothetical protein
MAIDYKGKYTNPGNPSNTSGKAQVGLFSIFGRINYRILIPVSIFIVNKFVCL